MRVMMLYTFGSFRKHRCYTVSNDLGHMLRELKVAAPAAEAADIANKALTPERVRKKGYHG